MALTQISSYAVAHNKNGGTGGTTYVMGGKSSNIYDSLNVNNINAIKGNIDFLQSKSISANDASFVYLVTKDGIIQKISGDELNYSIGNISTLTADSITTNKLKAEDVDILNAWITSLNSREITTEYLTVTKQAHFFELIIDKIRSVGGQIILTPTSCVADYVYGIDLNGQRVPVENISASNLSDITHFDIYWRATDEVTGRSTENGWYQDDQAICQSFNNVSEGVNYNIANKYYWRLVTNVYPKCYVNFSTGAISDNANESSMNSYTVIMKNTKTYDPTNEAYFDNNIAWTADEQLEDIAVDWIDGTLEQGEAVHGRFNTANVQYGIKIYPSIEGTDMPVTSYLDFNIKQIAGNSYKIPDKISIGIYFLDDTFKVFNDIHLNENGDIHLDLENPQAAIEQIVIISTADVKWHLCHHIRLSNTVQDTTPLINTAAIEASIPTAGDNLVQLGYRGNDEANANRKSAIIIAAYKSVDQGGIIHHDGVDDIIPPVVAPSYAQYQGIDDFDLYKHRKTYFDANGATFRGTFKTETGQDLETLIEEAAEAVSYLHIAYANSADGSVDFAKTPAVGVEYSYLGFCTNGEEDETNLTYSDYTWSLLPGKTGENGDSWDFAYKNTTSPTNPPDPLAAGTSTANLPINGWYKLPQTLQQGYYTWMSQCRVSGATGQYGTWETPVRLTGDKGEPGADGNEIEFIYTRNNTGIAPAAPPASSGPYPDDWPRHESGGQSIDHDTDDNGVTWYDNPQGVGDHDADPNAYFYEYMCQRIKRLDVWSVYSTPVVWSNWGKKGQDGDGYEYIYSHGLNGVAPAAPPAGQGPGTGGTYPEDWPNVDGHTPSAVDANGVTWYDDPQGVDTDHVDEYVSTRKKTNGVWSPYSTPALWGHYVSRGIAGGRYVMMYRQNSSATVPPEYPELVAASISTMESMGWSVTCPTQVVGQYIWMTQGFFESTATTAMWEPPIRITGDNGKPGEDGNSTEFIYKSFAGNDPINWDEVSTDMNPHNWAANQSPDYHGQDKAEQYWWSDNPTGVTETNVYEYVCQREYKYQSAGATTKTWGQFTTPKIWSRYGKDGRDGDGYEYIFTREFNGSAPSAPPTSGTYPEDWPNDGTTDHATDANGTVWYDDPQGVSQTYPEEYVSTRKKTNGVWGDYSTPALWAHWVDRGSQGQNGQYTQFIYKNAATAPSTPSTSTASIPTGWYAIATTPPTGQYTWCSTRTVTFSVDTNEPNYGAWSTPYRITGEDGQNGTDGDFVEFIYTRNNTGVAPAAPPTSGTYPRDWPNNGTTDHQTDGNGVTWYDNPQGVTSDMKWEYVSSREYNGSTQTWGDYSTPGIWSKFGENGRDGDGYEYIYKHFASEQTWGNNNNNPAYWAANQNPEYYGPTGYTWSDDPTGVTDTYLYEYVSVRKCTAGTWGKFSTPVLWAHWSAPGSTGPTGPQGPQGVDGQNALTYRLVDQGSAAYISFDLDEDNNVKQKLAFSLKFKVMKIDGSSMRYMKMSEMRDWTRLFTSWSNQNGFYVYVRYTRSTTSSPTYRYYKLHLNTDAADTADALFTVTYSGSFVSPDSNYTIINNRELTVALVEANISNVSTDTDCYFADTNTTVLGYLRDTMNIQVTSDPNTVSQTIGDSTRTLRTAINTNTANINDLQSDATQTKSRLQTVENNYVTQSTLTQTANQVRSEVVQIYNNANGYAKLTTVDLRSLSTTKFYPVAVSLPYWQGGSGTGKPPRVSIRVSRLIDINYGGPDYSKHHVGNDEEAALDGFPFTLEFSTMPCGWGNVWPVDLSKDNFDEPIFVNKVEISYTKAINGIPKNYIVPAIYQNYMGSKISNAGNDEIIYLRGGSKYDVESSWSDSTITLYSSDAGYSWSKDSFSFQKQPMEYDVNIGPVLQDQMSRSEIEQTASRISLSVFETNGVTQEDLSRTGIDIEVGKITLNANNTDVNGNLGVHTSGGGITLYDTSNSTLPRVSVINESIGPIGDDGLASSINLEDVQFCTPDQSTGYKEYNIKKFDLGTFNDNTLSISELKILPVSDYTNKITSITATIRLTTNSSDSEGTSGTQIWTGTLTKSGSYFYCTGIAAPSGTLTGHYYIGGKMTLYYSVFTGWEAGNWNIRRYLTGAREVPAGEKIQRIGNDGAIFKQTEERYAWFGDTQQRLRYNNSIVDNGVNGLVTYEHGWRYVQGQTNGISEIGISKMGDLQSVSPYAIYANNFNGNYYIPNNVSVVTIQQTCTAYLPSNAPYGKHYYISNGFNAANQATVTIKETGNTNVTIATLTSSKKCVHLVNFPYDASNGRAGKWVEV